MTEDKMGFNLPPGCKASEIPGNSAEDAAFEKFVDELAKLGIAEDEYAMILRFVRAALAEAREFASGRAQEAREDERQHWYGKMQELRQEVIAQFGRLPSGS